MSAGAAGGSFDPQQVLSQHVLKNFYVGGEWVKPQSDRTLELVSPVTEECFLRLPEASEADVDLAVKAARQAFDHGPWPRMTMAERAKFVTAIGEEMKKRLPLLIDVWTAQVGAPKSFAGFVIQYGPQLFEFYGQLGAKGEPVEQRDGQWIEPADQCAVRRLQRIRHRTRWWSRRIGRIPGDQNGLFAGLTGGSRPWRG